MENRFSSLARCSLLVFAFLCGTSLYAQRTVTGTVLDAEMGGEPMIGATVQVKGTQTATMTDIDGNFSINANNTDVLVFSFIGYEPKSVTVGNQSNIRVELGVNAEQLEEVVAIGYGTVKKSDLTGAVSVVTSKDLTKQPAMNVGQAIQGKASGVLVSQSGTPGEDPTIRVRGVGSINRAPNPIYVVDGVIVGGIGNISAQDIESFQVLKDASSAAIYGANGANGVVIITTKRGKAGKTQVNFNAFGSVTLKPEKYDVMNASEYAQFYNEFAYPDMVSQLSSNQGYALSEDFRKAYYGDGWEKGTDWQDQMFNNGYRQNYDLSITGGGEKSNYSISFGYMDEKGTIIASGANRFNLRANSDFSIGKWVKVGENIAVSRQERQDFTNTAEGSVYELKQSPLMRIYNRDTKKGSFDKYEAYDSQYFFDLDGNFLPLNGNEDYVNSNKLPYWEATLGNEKPNTLVGPATGDRRSYSTNALISAYMEVNFTDWLQYKFTPSADVSFRRLKDWRPAYEKNRSKEIAELSEEWGETLTLGVENQLTFKKSFNDKHNLQVIAVHQMRKSDGNSSNTAVKGFNFEKLNTLTNYIQANAPVITGYYNPYRMISYLGRAMYDFRGRYLLTASIRADGVSRFAQGNRWGYFPSVSAAWKFNEDLMPGVEVIDMWKLRFGWGQTGNSDIGDFQYLSQLTNALQFAPVFGDDQHLADAQYIFAQFGFPGIKWEAADMYNIGFDLNMLRNRLQLSAEYYIKQQNDLLVRAEISAVYGLDGNGARPWMNLGKLSNRGLELNASWRDDIGAFSYGVSGNLTTIKNEVKSLPTNNITNGDNANDLTAFVTRTMAGHAIGQMYGWVSEGVVQATDEYYFRNEQTGQLDFSKYKFADHNGVTPQPGDLKFKDIDGNGIVNNEDRTLIGKPVPDFTYSLNIDFGYKGIDLSLFFYGVQNYDVYNAQRATMSSINAQNNDHNKFADYGANYYRMDRPTAEYVRVDKGNENKNDRMSSFWVEDGSFMRLKSLQLGYSLPAKATKKMKISNARIYVDAQNLFTVTKYKGRDPEPLLNGEPLSTGSDNGVYPVPKAFSVGLQIGF